MKKPLILALLSVTMVAHAQKVPEAKYGKLTATDLERKIYPIDSSASAVVLYEAGSTEVEGNTKGWFSLVYKEYKRIHILKKSAYDEADIEIPLYTYGNEEEDLQSLKATTYNLEGGKVV